MKFLKLSLAIALSVALFTASISCSITNSGSKDIEGSTEMKAKEIYFPKDHCFHNNDNEWIYFSGIVETSERREFGLMFTIFQFPDIGERFSYPSMLGISDPEIPRFYSARINGQNGTAGSTPDGLPSIHAGDSRFIWDPTDNLHIASFMNTLDLTRISVEMDMKPTRDILFHGEDGFILMGDGIPSGYYSLTNLLPINGTLCIGDQQHTIIGGRIWMDHQWGDWTWFGYAWDWFSLRFDDGGAFMLFQFRDANEVVVRGGWTYRDKDGLVDYGTDFEVVAKRMFRSYPIEWTVTIPSIDAEFKVKPLFDDQTFTGLWEGLCDVSGRVGTSQLTGQAFVELNGY